MKRVKTDRLTSVVVLVWAVAGVVLLTTLFRTLNAIGLFTFVSPVSPGTCRTLPLPGAGAMAYEAKSKTLFIATRDPRNPSAPGALYALADGAGTPVRLAGTPADFHPGALSIGYDVGGAPSLAVVDHKPQDRVALELYGVRFEANAGPGGGIKLDYQSSIQSGLARRGGGIANLGNSRLYLTANPTGSALLAWADRWLVLGRAYLLFYNSTVFQQAVSGISDPSAVTVSPAGDHIYIASRAGRRITALSREAFTGALTELDSVTVPLRPEQLSLDANNVLWVVGPARLPDLSGASRVVRIFLDGEGKPQNQETVYAGDGIKAATGVAKTENKLFIGSFSDNKMLSCDLK